MIREGRWGRKRCQSEQSIGDPRRSEILLAKRDAKLALPKDERLRNNLIAATAEL